MKAVQTRMTPIVLKFMGILALYSMIVLILMFLLERQPGSFIYVTF